MRFDVLTIFPKIFDSYLKESLVRRAQEKMLIHIKIHNIRDFSVDRHRKVDSRPFGGGPGMVLQIAPIFRAVKALTPARKGKERKTRIILFSTRGKKFNSVVARRLSHYDRLILVCGRYEGVDERVASYIADEEISIGEYVLSGGELPALVVIESVSRFLPGFLGKKESLEELKGSYPVYSRPEVFFPVPGKKKPAWRVPSVLRSGNHKKIQVWRHGQRQKKR